ncbi:class I SAM-dependent methyltransferase [Actinoplanes sp. LDG1-06]|uniref:Class I SAM-dependent methyltransferase n=1 Tax=Paractinoplanes ovalisporus TaxID=2810368 RepID=A0ABS2AB62_9ACTN|nr:class I SAM-dependent methyltransferase [Actinoplanes ovalisporus]MBM2617065.1 class I SAM-dependent methyltransferase [Actinoplanes ovalisporus]
MPSTALDSAPWRATWDEVMTGFVPGLPSLEDVIACAARDPRRILDLGGGPGVFAERLAARWPSAQVTMIDIDPVLLALARDGVPPAVSVLEADLCDALPAGFDLITAVMTVHYLRPERIRALYRRCRQALTLGGLLVIADLMPDDGLPSVMDALNPAPGEAAAELAWAQWWGEVAEAPEFAQLMADRADIFRHRPPANFAGSVSWHVAAARSAGFREAGVVWRDGRHAALVAV